MFQALLILLAAATPGAAGDNAKQSPQPAEKNHFESVKQICEALPSTPNHSLNDVALQVACEEANKWLQKNAVGAAVQVAGTVSSLRRQSGPTVFNPKQRDNRPQIFLHLGLQPHAARWHGFTLHVTYDAVFPADSLKSLSHVEKGDRAAVKGTVALMTISWAKNEKAELRVTLRDCALVKAEKPSSVKIETAIPTKSTPPLTDMRKWTKSSGYTFRGQLLGLYNEKAYFLTETSRLQLVPMKTLGGDDQKRVRDAVVREMKKEQGREAVSGRTDPFTD